MATTTGIVSAAGQNPGDSVNSWYKQYLGRDAQANEQQAWTSGWDGFGGSSGVENAIRTSPEARSRGLVAQQLDQPAQTVKPPEAKQLDAPTQWNVTDDQTVEGRINRIIHQGSPLQEQAKTRAQEQMNARGLGNSSLAITAGESALYDAAMPIAQADAATTAKAAGYNADTANQFAVHNVDTENQFRLTGMEDARIRSLAGADDRRIRELAQQEDARMRALAGEDVNLRRDLASQEDARLRALAGSEDQRTRELAQLEDARIRSLQGSEDKRARDLAAMEDSRVRDLQAAEDKRSRDLALINRETQVQLTQLDAQNKLRADQVAQQNQRLLETNAQAASAFQTAMSAINNIQNNNGMDAGAKTQAVANVWRDLQVQMRVMQDVSGLDLTSKLNFAGYPGFDANGNFVGFDEAGGTVGSPEIAPGTATQPGIVSGAAAAAGAQSNNNYMDNNYQAGSGA